MSKKKQTKKKTPKPDKVDLIAWLIRERMEHEGGFFTREESNDDGVVWYYEGGVDEVKDDDELLNTLEEEYHKSKQGYGELFKK